MHASMRFERQPSAPTSAAHDRARAWTCRLVAGLGLFSAALLAAAPALAHKSSDAYLFFDQQAEQTTLRWDIALRDLDLVLALDADGDRQLTWGEIRNAWPRIDALALTSLAVPGCRFGVTGHALERRQDGVYAVLNLSAPCQMAPGAAIHYSLLADVDSTHRGIVRQTVAGAGAAVRMLVPAAIPGWVQGSNLAAAAVAEASASRAATGLADAVQAASAPSADRGAPRPQAASPLSSADAGGPPVASPTADAHAPSFVGEGVHHIVTGYDHLLFLLCLLLPAVLRRESGPPAHWQAVAGWRQAMWPVTKTVTLFTLAHSVTLALAALGWVKLSPSLVEPAIAATIMLAAVDNLRPTLLRWRGAVTFGFGLIHGFGFAGVLGELQLPPAQFGWALFQFNAGLELGQLALVLTVVPLLFALRRRPVYVPLVLRTGSALALLMAAVWLVERTTDWAGPWA